MTDIEFNELGAGINSICRMVDNMKMDDLIPEIKSRIEKIEAKLDPAKPGSVRMLLGMKYFLYCANSIQELKATLSEVAAPF